LPTFIKICNYLLRVICVCLVSLIPKKKPIWVFGAWFGKSFSDNPKYMYLYVTDKFSSEITSVWIAKDIELVSELKKQGVNAHYHKSLRGIYYQIVAKVVFVSHSLSADLNSFCIGLNTKRVQLFHGVPFKKIGFDDYIFTNKNLLIQKYPTLYSWLTNDRYNLVTSTGSACSKHFSSAFNIPINKIITTGFPRNDVFHKPQMNPCSNSTYKVIYMPTFRGDIGDNFDLFEKFGFDPFKIDELFTNQGIELDIRTHPVNRPSDDFISKISNCQCINISTVSDIYEEINNYDCLITDYSSIMFDFAISKKTVLFAPFDLNSYLNKNRELYHPYEEICNGLYYKNWNELVDAILMTKGNRNAQYTNEFINSYHDIGSLKDNYYSESVFKAVKNLTS
jgi:CDP-glycerol glycerophosphotransferase (TagB/SpsB family)